LLVESICKTILKDRKYPCYDDLLELPKLVKYTAKKLKLTPENHSNTKVEQSFIQVINGMVTATYYVKIPKKLTIENNYKNYSKSFRGASFLLLFRNFHPQKAINIPYSPIDTTLF
jgi:hypothetical protein